MSRQFFEIRGEFITLGQFLKANGEVSIGAEVKAVLEEASILVDGEIETRRGRKLRPGQTVTFPDGRVIEFVAVGSSLG